MSGFWLGFVTLPIAMVLSWILVVALRWLGDLSGRAAASLLRLTPSSGEDQRANVGAVVYSAHKVWMLGLGNVGIVFISGQGARDAAAASDRLRERAKVRLRRRFTDPAPAEASEVEGSDRG